MFLRRQRFIVNGFVPTFIDHKFRDNYVNFATTLKYYETFFLSMFSPQTTTKILLYKKPHKLLILVRVTLYEKEKGTYFQILSAQWMEQVLKAKKL